MAERSAICHHLHWRPGPGPGIGSWIGIGRPEAPMPRTLLSSSHTHHILWLPTKDQPILRKYFLTCVLDKILSLPTPQSRSTKDLQILTFLSALLVIYNNPNKNLLRNKFVLIWRASKAAVELHFCELPSEK